MTSRPEPPPAAPVSPIRRCGKSLAAGAGLLLFLEGVLAFLPGEHHPAIPGEDWPGFYAAAGFFSCVLLVLFARFLVRPLLARREDFYGPAPAESGDSTDA